jgi:hypothetical protein
MVVLTLAELLAGVGSGEVEVTFTVLVMTPELAAGATWPISLIVIVSVGVTLPGVQVMVLVPVHVPLVAVYD